MDMDIDMDIDADLGIGDDERVLSDPTNIETAELHNIPTESPKRILNKVHVRGLNDLNPDQVKAYVAEHYSTEPVVKIEWIDDSSANLIFATDAAARDALQGLIADPANDPEERPAHECILAKPFSAKPDDSFEVRFAIETDKKQAGAAARSRFYLFHPEFDPQERRRRDDSRRYRERDDYGRGRRGRDRRHREEEEEDTFDVSLYDDDEVTLASRAERLRRQRRRSSSRSDIDTGDHYRPRRTNEDKELFPGRRPRESGLRSRSTSPTRNRDSYETEDDDLIRKSRSRAQEIKEKLSHDNSFKELFPSKHTMTTSTSHMDRAEEVNDLMGRKKYGMSYGSTVMDTVSDVSIRGMAAQSDAGIGISIKGRASKSVKELFPDKFGSNNGKELFADGPGGRNRRRQKAEDLFT